MLTLSPGVQVFVAPGVTDMRKSFDTLAALAKDVVGGDPMSGHLFAFCNRKRDRMKVLYWDRSGYCLLAKRLERGKFAWPKTSREETSVEMTSQELMSLLGGLDVSRETSDGWYDWHATRARSPRSKVGSTVRA